MQRRNTQHKRLRNHQTQLPCVGSLRYLQRSSALESVALYNAVSLPHFSGISSDISGGDRTKRPLTVLLPHRFVLPLHGFAHSTGESKALALTSGRKCREICAMEPCHHS